MFEEEAEIEQTCSMRTRGGSVASFYELLDSGDKELLDSGDYELLDNA